MWNVVDPDAEQHIKDEAKDSMTMALQVVEESAFKMWIALHSMHMEKEHAKEAKVQMLRWKLENLCMGNEESIDDLQQR